MKKVVSGRLRSVQLQHYQSCYREEEIKARLHVVELFLESIVSQNRRRGRSMDQLM